MPILAGLGWRFDVVVAGDTLPQRKPAPGPLLHALKGVEGRGDAIYVGDSEVDRSAAEAADVRFVAVAWGRVAGPDVPLIHRLDAALAWEERGGC